MAVKREPTTGSVRVSPGPDRSHSAPYPGRCFFLSIVFCSVPLTSH
jgi:hypothetical protein